MTDILKKILDYKTEELAHFQRNAPLADLKARVGDMSDTQNFVKGLQSCPEKFSVIAEIKRRSPSKGLLREKFAPVEHATDYQKNGAAALSILTDEHFFGGHLDDLRKVRQAVDLPLLRKDFFWDPYQVYAAREAGADAILLIAAMLGRNQMEDLWGLTRELGLSCLAEVHSVEEVEKCLSWQPPMVGVNNRNLKTFEVDLGTSERVFKILPPEVMKISESGIAKTQDLIQLQTVGAQAFLVGELFMKAPQPGEALTALLGKNS